METKVDLRELAGQRAQKPSTPGPQGRRRRLLTRFVLPALLLAGFAALIAFAVRESLDPPRPVTVVPVIVSQIEMEQAADTPLFRAAGWVEPRPTPTFVTALAEGVVERLFVVEGQELQEGDPVARLVPADAKIALDGVEADVNLREGELASARVALTAARARLDMPLHLKVEVAEAEAALARAETELGNIPHLLRAAQARLQYARLELESKRRAPGAVPEVSLLKSKSDVEEADAAAEELVARQKRLPVEIAALKDKRDALAQKLQRKIDEIRQAGEAEAAVQTAEARLRQAQALRDAARLRLERMEVRAPSRGRVLALIARPGTRLMGMDPRSLNDSSMVVSLYDPASLQIRVDVRLDDVGKVLPAQKVKIETAALPGQSLDGQVLTATSQADIQKNTLSVKVAISAPPANLKPDMLCQVMFLAVPRSVKPADDGSHRYRLLIPRQLVETGGDGSRVWVAGGPGGLASLRRIEVGLSSGELIEVLSGLGTTDRLIVSGREGLKDGDRIKVVGEDESLGIVGSAGGKKPGNR